MNKYPFDEVSTLVRGIVHQAHLDEDITICFREQWEMDRQFISILVALPQHQQSGVDLDLCPWLD